MASTFWIGFAIFGVGVLIGFLIGASDRDTSLLAGLAMGAFLGLMFGLPLLAIGVSTS